MSILGFKMKKLIAIAATVALSAAGQIAPALATTSGDTSNYGQHALDCLGLLFSDPKAHAEQCGGPNFVLPDPPHGSTGFAACGNVVEIDPFGIDGIQYKLVAYPSPIYCCGGADA